MADPIAALREALQDRYAFERELGRGGMATVYLARDLRHDRPVALKVLHPELAASARPRAVPAGDPARRPAAAPAHPHGARLRRGRRGALLWFTMPYVEGESLRDRLRRERQLPVEDALRITREAAQALAVRPRAGRHPPRHQAREPAPHPRRQHARRRLRDRPGARRGAATSADRDRPRGRHAGLHESGAGRGRARRSTRAPTSTRSAAVLYEMLAGEAPYTGADGAGDHRASGSPSRAPSVRPFGPTCRRRWTRRSERRSPRCRPTASGGRGFGRALASAPAGSLGRRRPRLPATRQRRPRSLAIARAGLLLGLGVLFGWLRRPAATPATPAARSGSRCSPSRIWAPTDGRLLRRRVTDEVRGKLAASPGLQVTASRQRDPVQEVHQGPARSAASWGWTTCSSARCGGRKARPGQAACG